VFEVVESEQIRDEDHLKDIVDYYRAKGFRIALDDVGSGYSSLNLLVALEPDVIKVDLKIIRDIDKLPANQAVFQALAGIAAQTGALLLAEGVETAAELDWCRAHGASLAQGYFWGPPVALPDPSSFLSTGRRPHLGQTPV
jgi:EAL domain-containing protein (putative c-di-GMP-specific phosphodiesterase class I)